jgi:anti-sigma B factor antagonist
LAVLIISGEHDLSTAPNLRRRLDGLLDERSGVVVDLSPATFIDSSILGVILDGKRRAAEAGLGYAVLQSNGAEAVGRVLEVTGLRAELPVHSGREEAVAAASESSGQRSR